MDAIQIRPMSLSDYDDVIAIMKEMDGVVLRNADSRDSIERYLRRNPDCSFVAVDGAAIIGCIMSGHDGRRGYLHHLAVLPAYRRRGVAASLVEHCMDALEREGIQKFHIDVLQGNVAAQQYWEGRGWQLRTDIHRYSFVRCGGENA